MKCFWAIVVNILQNGLEMTVVQPQLHIIFMFILSIINVNVLVA